MSQNKNQGKPAEQKTSPLAGAVLVVLLALLLGGLALGFMTVQRSAAAKRAEQTARATRLAENKALGLPLDYPADFLPIWPGATIKEQSKGEVKSTDGGTMDQWKVHAETDSDKSEVYEYYNAMLLGAGMSQTVYASVPNGYGVTYADEQREIQFTIEKKRADPRTQLEITFSQMR